MPYQYFTTPYKKENWEPKFLLDTTVSFGNKGKYESDGIKVGENFFNIYPDLKDDFTSKMRLKYLSTYKTITFEPEDDFKDILLKVKPKELSLRVFDKAGLGIRMIKMFNVQYQKSENVNEIKIKFKSFEDKYF